MAEKHDHKGEAESKKDSKDEFIEIPVSKALDGVRKNPWIVSTVVLAVLAIVLVVMLVRGGAGGGISANAIGPKAVDFINAELLQGQGTVTLDAVNVKGGLYEVVVDYKGQKVPSYFTKDGAYFLGNQIVATSADLSAGSDAAPPKEVPKTDKPNVELFIMSYCPYGTQAEKGIIPVLNLLNGKIDGGIKFTHFTLHGEKEDTENFRQMCIREEQSTKFLPYLTCILNSTDPNAPADVNACMQKIGVDSAKVTSCISGKAKDYYAVDSALSTGYGVQGSPTLVINGVISSAGRDSVSYLKAICAAFNNEPAECATVLSSAQPSPGFGLGTTDNTNLASC